MTSVSGRMFRMPFLMAFPASMEVRLPLKESMAITVFMGIVLSVTVYVSIPEYGIASDGIILNYSKYIIIEVKFGYLYDSGGKPVKAIVISMPGGYNL